MTEGEEEDGDYRMFGFVIGFRKNGGAFPLNEPEKLGGKLFSVRETLGLNLAGMAARLSDEKVFIARQDVHRYERGEMDPSIIIILRYSRLADVRMEVFADDNLDFPMR